jgi:hypothetical protein
MRASFLGALALVLAGPSTAIGHAGGTTGYAAVAVSRNAIRYTLTLPPSGFSDAVTRRLQRVAAGDADAGAWLLELIRERVVLIADDTRCEAGRGGIVPARGSESVTAIVDFACARPVQRLAIQDDTFEVLGPDHHTLVKLEAAGGVVHQAALERGAARFDVALAAAAEPSHGGGFVRLGVEHILTGVDHMLFLAALLLGGGGAIGLLKTVTAFTVAHSVTLALAVLGNVTLPGRIVEPVIAASIGWVAVENLMGRRTLSHRWLVSLAFGLVHGFGFAGALSPLSLPRASLASALLGFNVGVEIGQLLVIGLVVPLLVWSRRRGWEQALVRGGSIALILMSFVWFVERLLA